MDRLLDTTVTTGIALRVAGEARLAEPDPTLDRCLGDAARSAPLSLGRNLADKEPV